MKTIMIYESQDGRQFVTEEDCLEYEQHCINTKEANEMWRAGATMMEVLIRANKSQPGWDYMLSSKDRLILHKITKDTQFVLCSGQRNNPPMCKVKKIYNNKYIKLQKNMYGLYASLTDLLQYAHQTPL